MGDINIDMKDSKAIGFNKLSDFMDLYNLKNIVKDNLLVTIKATNH